MIVLSTTEIIIFTRVFEEISSLICKRRRVNMISSHTILDAVIIAIQILNIYSIFTIDISLLSKG